ncbi:uncharacterized protein LOC118644706 isoform X2 [Monomorium pharaonis]|uniref:uncharacterized protein LOC118644706 isoform X2 n=1 Tax=Monomorium pharaonis TaxID=307658 RepID=UPI001747BD7E|nr:uncharacterized protein LOC118644706 isoform X2 [Monomorium pharaonis]
MFILTAGCKAIAIVRDEPARKKNKIAEPLPSLTLDCCLSSILQTVSESLRNSRFIGEYPVSKSRRHKSLQRKDFLQKSGCLVIESDTKTNEQVFPYVFLRM